MYLTLRQIADKYKIVSTICFAEFVLEHHRKICTINPDISVSALSDLFMIDTNKHSSAVLIRQFTQPADTPDKDTIDALESLAIVATARYVAACNKVNWVDFDADMRLEPDAGTTPREHFMVDEEGVDSVIDHFARRISKLLPELQR